MEISNATTAENDVAMKMRSNNPYAQRNTTLEHRIYRECPNGGKQDTTASASHIHTPSRQPPVQLPPDMDDDAMINEYMDYDNEEPPDYIDHELEDYENFVLVDSNQNTIAQNGLPEMNIRNSTTNTIINNMNTVQQQRDTSTVPQHTVAIFREEDSDDEMITATSAGRSRVVNGPKRDLYKFERYLEHSQWRTEKIHSPMRAKKWKSNTPNNGETFGNRMDDDDEVQLPSLTVKTSSYQNSSVPTTSDAMLLSFLCQRHLGTTITAKQQQRKRCCSMSHSPIEGKTCLPMTLGDGVRVYIPIQKLSNDANVDVAKISNESQSPSTLSSISLGVSMDALLNRVQINRRKREYEKVLQETNFLTKSLDVVHDIERTSQGPDTAGMKSPTSVTTNKWIGGSSHLWVDKHAPRSFAHLLSDERNNREVVRALREWDPYVFHREPPKRPDYILQQRKYNVSNKTDDLDKLARHSKNDVKSKDTRPNESSRVILLSGPPGVGKTTLAHIVARHVGYRPIEVNGSDERTETALTDRVVRAMESSTIHFGDHSNGVNNIRNRPNCLILDEIDGADAAKAIQSLVDIIRAEIPTKGTKSKTPYLRRPIIFICNNKFVPALKPLLPYARQFNIYPPSTTRLVSRLRAVLNVEDMSLSAGGNSLLNQLVVSSCGDIRSCLYTLQFASSRAKVLSKSTLDNSSSLTNEGIYQSSTLDISTALESTLSGDGLKDVRSDIVGTITSIFHKVKNDDPFGRNTVRRIDRFSSVDKVLNGVRSFGDNSRVLDSLYVNLLRVSYIDPSFDRCSAALEWISSSDVYRSNKQLSSADGYSVEALHTPAVAAAIHILCRVEQPQDLTYSTRDLSDSQYQMEANKALIQKFLDGLSLRAKCTRSGLNQIATETVPYSLWILSAGEGSGALNRTVTSLDLLSKGEYQAFEHHCEILRTLGLKYVAVHDDSFRSRGQLHHLSSTPKAGLDPPIDRLVQFVDMPNDRLEVPVALKQMLCRKTVFNTSSTKRESAKEPIIKRKASTPSAAVGTSNFLLQGAKKAKALRSARTAARVGCNHAPSTENSLTKVTTNNRLSNTGTGIPLSEVIRLKYVKGFTQAVSMPCRLEDIS